jgi:hypothetical protein
LEPLVQFAELMRLSIWKGVDPHFPHSRAKRFLDLYVPDVRLY